MDPQTQILSFYGWWQMIVCLFAFIALMGIWYHIGRKRGDLGQVWLAFSVLCWSLSGAVEVFLTADSGAHLLEGYRSILSLFNSLFILLALPWFRYLPGSLEPLIKSRYWNYVVGLPFVFSLLPTINKMAQAQSGLISELDVYYATLTLIFLGVVLYWSFAKRRLKVLAYLSVVSILITFGAQILKLGGSDVNMTLFSAIFKTTLIMIFFALALSWVKELVEDIIPVSEALYLSFLDNSVGSKSTIELKGLPGQVNQELLLTPAMHELLYTFATKKVQGDQWLEIKPKNESRAQKHYDIHDHNQIKRLGHTLLDGLFGKGLWDRHKHELPLKETMFEFSERRVRLRIPAANINLNHSES